jgi:archaemetzincin
MVSCNGLSCIALLCLLLFSSCKKNGDVTVVAIQPYDNFDTKYISTVASAVQKVYGFECITLPHKPIPKETITTIKTPRYRADLLLKLLEQTKPDTVTYILGLTKKDISTTKRDQQGNIKEPQEKYRDWGIFGLGYMPGASCVASTFRLSTPQNKLTDRLQKVCIHELGHNLGLDHCENKHCVMTDAAESIKTIDQVNVDLCMVCKDKISH